MRCLSGFELYSRWVPLKNPGIYYILLIFSCCRLSRIIENLYTAFSFVWPNQREQLNVFTCVPESLWVVLEGIWIRSETVNIAALVLMNNKYI